MKTDAKGNLYIALYEGGQVLVADPAGKLLATIDPPAPNVSNVAFGRRPECALRHGRARPSAAPWPGEVYRIANPIPQ